ncbi:MAG: prepilin-type N-terminal cleavage/methylation domain-containing protein [Bacillota bacterium]|nr:prepilin-type N-terminal cleavage/methylation domain-containing protein [Bacillota bacterium]
MNFKNNKGFTLIEVITAIAIVAIVSGSLLEMFVLPAKMNSKADAADKANTMAVKTAEYFKADPIDFFNGTPTVTMFANNTIIQQQKDGNGQLAGTGYTKYYDSRWNELGSSNGASYMLTANVSDRAGSSSQNTYLANSNAEFSPQANIDNQYTLSVANGGQITLTGSGGYSVQNIYSGNNTIGSRLGVIFNYPSGDTKNYVIHVDNQSGLPVDLYVYNAPVRSFVSIDPLNGESSISYIPDVFSQCNLDLNQNNYTLSTYYPNTSDKSSFNLIFKDGTGNLILNQAGINTASVGGTLTLGLNYPLGSSQKFNIAVDNKLDIPVELNVTDSPGDNYVTLTKVSGESSIISEASGNSEYVPYSITVIITKLSDNSILTNYTAEKYMASDGR